MTGPFWTRWFAGQLDVRAPSLVQTQIQQSWARMGFATAGLVYLALHAPYFPDYGSAFMVLAGIYFAVAAASIPLIRRRPVSVARLLANPMFDVLVVSVGMMLDGGHGSGLFFMYFVIIFGNGLRYGNQMMVYSQAATILGLVGVCIFSLVHFHLALDRVLLAWQVLALLGVPFYVIRIGEKAERAAFALRETEESAFRLLDAGPVPVFTYDLNELGNPRILYCNAAVNQISREDYTSLIGEQADMLTLMEDGQAMLHYLRRALESTTHRPLTFFVRGRNRQDRVLSLMCTATRMRWRGDWIGVCFAMDITERELIRSQLDEIHRHGYMSTMVAGVVHDFRNVLTTIIGLGEVMQAELRDEEQAKQIEAIIQAAERGSEMVTKLLRLGRKHAPERRYVRGAQLATPLENIVGLARLQLPPHVELHAEIQPGLPDLALDEVEIEQILLNLIHNAGHAFEGRDHGRIEVVVRADSEHPLASPGGPALIIEVRDDGVGIPEEDLPHIFKPFWTKRGEEGGSGLGLAMVDRLVRDAGGSIEVESTPGQGTRFVIALPAAKAPEEREPDARKRPPSAGTNEPRRARILLVDDAPDVLEIHETMLRAMGHETVAETDPRKALQRLREDPRGFDLLITDYRMPGMDGLELIRTAHREKPDLPALMITAYGEEERLQEVHDRCVEILNKPASMACIREAIARMLACGS